VAAHNRHYVRLVGHAYVPLCEGLVPDSSREVVDQQCSSRDAEHAVRVEEADETVSPSPLFKCNHDRPRQVGQQ
jgi:hypothetical protein